MRLPRVKLRETLAEPVCEPVGVERIAREHRLLIEAIQAADTPTAIYDDQDRLIAWNHAYAHIHGEAFAHFEDKIEAGMLYYEDLIRYDARHLDPENVEAYIADRLAAQRSGTGELVDRYYPGKGWYRITKIRTPSGAVAGFATDITELKETAASLARANEEIEAATAAKTEFVARMSHETRTPLGGMLGLARALADTELDETQRRYVDAILQSGRLLTRQLNDSLDLAKIESGRIELEPEAFDPVALCQQVQQLYAPVAAEKGLVLDLAVGDLDGCVTGDARKIQQILNNLVYNAVKFTQTGGVILGAAPRPGDADRAGLEFTVRDTGPGIEAKDQHRIFQEFTQLDEPGHAPGDGGTGLGLTISKRLAALMGGDLWLSSRVGEGSVFTLSLPLERACRTQVVDECVPATPTDLRNAGPGGRALRILIVDDNEVNRFLLNAFLSPLGAELMEATDGAEAVEAFRSAAPDIVLMDYHMPLMDGLTACRQIREMEGSPSRCQIYSLSADITSEHVAYAQEAGANGTLAKPVDFDELSAILIRS